MLRASVVFGVALASCLWPVQVPAQVVADRALDANRAAAVDEAVRSVMAEQQLVGLAVGVIRDGRVVYLKGYGFADRDRRTPVTTETVFNWASNSKPLAAVLALRLAEEGKLDLDADVRRYVPEFPSKGAIITSRQLLCHQSGIPHYANGKIVPADRSPKGPRDRPDPILSLDRFSGSPLIFSPGEKSEYSSYAYILLSAVVQRAGERGFDEQVKDRIARPLRMTSLQLDGGTPEPEWAVGYRKKGDLIVRAPEEANDWKFGAGGYKSNVRDFARWAQALINHELVSPKTERMMWTTQVTRGGKATPYGLGFAVEDGRQGFKVSHNGSQTETTTRVVLYPKAGHGVVVLCNCGFAKIGEVSTAVYSGLGRK